MDQVTKDVINVDCKYFRNDRPCVFHKKEKVWCENCPHYAPITTRILIIKLDAAGDVLRTTSILSPLLQAYPRASVAWISKGDALPLFNNNPYVHQVVEYGPEAQSLLMAEEFDLAINLDAAPSSSRLMSIARSTKKLGFEWNPRGFSEPLSPEAALWFRMGIRDDLKKANESTYQEIMMKICGLEGRPDRPVFIIDDNEKTFAADFARTKGFTDKRPVIGLNTGAGSRWRYKKWTLDGYRQLILKLESLVSRFANPALRRAGRSRTKPRSRLKFQKGL